MTIRTLPAAPAMDRRPGLSSDVSPRALERWNSSIHAAATDDNTISMFGEIGQSWDGGGVTASRISAALRSIGGKDVTVNLNSPGGDMFEGLAIYSLLRDYKGKVTIKVLGLAASAASIIAMAADELQIARAGFLMIHNCWVMAIGNKEDLRAFADTLEPFDAAMGDIYAARTGLEPKVVAKMMTTETWIGGSAAVDKGFADSLLPADAVAENKVDASHNGAVRAIDTALAKAGMPRTERRKLIQELKAGTRDAAEGTHDAAVGEVPLEVVTGLQAALLSMRLASVTQ